MHTLNLRYVPYLLKNVVKFLKCFMKYFMKYFGPHIHEILQHYPCHMAKVDWC